jgi:hypothetical protein
MTTPAPLMTPAMSAPLILGSNRTGQIPQEPTDRALLTQLRDVEVTRNDIGTIRIQNTDTAEIKNVLGVEIAPTRAIEAFVVPEPEGNRSYVVPFDNNNRVMADVDVGGIQFRTGDRVGLARAGDQTTIKVFDQNDLPKAALTMNPQYEAPARETVDALENFDSSFMAVQRVQQNPADTNDPILMVRATPELKARIEDHR